MKCVLLAACIALAQGYSTNVASNTGYSSNTHSNPGYSSSPSFKANFNDRRFFSAESYERYDNSPEIYDVDTAVRYLGDAKFQRYFSGDRKKLKDYLRWNSLEVNDNDHSLEDLYYRNLYNKRSQNQRYKRQSGYGTMDYGSSHTDKNGIVSPSFTPNYNDRRFFSAESFERYDNSPEIYDVDTAISYLGDNKFQRYFSGDRQKLKDYLRWNSLEVNDNDYSLEDLYYRNLYNKQNSNNHGTQNQRYKRQATYNAMGLASSHTNKKGVDRKPFRPHFQLNAHGSGNNLKNYGIQGGVGAGTVLWRSKNKNHSLGAGVYGSQFRGSSNGHRFSTKPDIGFGLGYKWRF